MLPKLSPEKRSEIDRLHREASEVIQKINLVCKKKIENPEKATILNKKILGYNALLEELEFEMQNVWGFEQDAKKHTWWLRCEYCTCPKMDNTDPAFYGGGKIISENCPVHAITKPIGFWKKLLKRFF